MISHDLFMALNHLIQCGLRSHPTKEGVLPTQKAAVAFVIQLAIDNGHDASAFRQLEKQLMAVLEE